MRLFASIPTLLVTVCSGFVLLTPCRGGAAEIAPPSERKLPGESAGAPKPTPPLPGTKSPAALFRELLGMTAAQRAEALRDRTEHERGYVVSRLREYEALPPEQREARLRQLELTHYLPPLMKLSPANRSNRLDVVPPELRPIIDERLRQWDLLPPQVQQRALEHETTANYFLRVRSAPDGSLEQRAAPAPTPEPALEDGPRNPSAFSEFFALPRHEQQKTLGALPPAERDEMERTLRQFAALPPEQRKICIESFDKLQRMTRPQRDQFLKSAARWKAMTPQERETWRALVSILPPTPTASILPPKAAGAEPLSGPVTASNSPARPGGQN